MAGDEQDDGAGDRHEQTLTFTQPHRDRDFYSSGQHPSSRCADVHDRASRRPPQNPSLGKAAQRTRDKDEATQERRPAPRPETEARTRLAKARHRHHYAPHRQNRDRFGQSDALPVTVSTPISNAKNSKRKPFTGNATVRLLDKTAADQAGMDGPLLTVTPAAGATSGDAQVAIDYSTFAQSYGGAYARRLQLVQLPACAATTPDLKHCTATRPVAFRNDPKAETLTATSVTVPAADSGTATAAAAPVVLAVTAGTSSDQGDYTATSLSPSATWSTNLNTGDFTWSYDIPVPGIPGSFAPKIGLSYASGGVDGRTVNTNNQSSWVGDGFGLGAGSIERSYKPCRDDDVTNADGNKPSDLCWAYDNATISFDGHRRRTDPHQRGQYLQDQGR